MFFISKLWIERQKHINTDYYVTGLLLCVIPYIRENVFKNSNRNHINQVNTVIKTLFAGLSEKQFHENIDTFWGEYTKSIIKMIILTVIIYLEW